jgi:exodeoxyribonuclease VII small subunit
MSFEENMEALEKTVQELENGNLNLEDSIKKFEEGINLSKKCNDILEEAEKRITVLIKKDDKIEEENF